MSTPPARVTFPSDHPLVRRLVHIAGVVQGVGFRPFVHALAKTRGLTGTVRNRGGTVGIEVQGSESDVAAFMVELRGRHPPAARIDLITTAELPPRPESEFTISESETDDPQDIGFAPDAATCDRCLADVDDESSRWFGYPFTSCSACGPRFTIVTGAPYDRERTTMRVFALCPECRADYAEPARRRFHAQTIACPKCGPKLMLRDGQCREIDAINPLAQAAAWVRQGKIGAIKGIGGFHLFCDATNVAAVGEIRRRKERDEKPLAIMVGGVPDAANLCELDVEEEQWLRSAARPIVLLRHRPDNGLAPSVSHGLPHTGVMLPYTALHYLLLNAVAGSPLVMTSGNVSDEPTAFRDADAQRLGGIADFFLVHNREIISRCDDSVVRLAGAQPIFIRRSRGYAPAPLIVPFNSTTRTLAVGGQLKATFALGEANRAILSHHVGDLDDFETLLDFEHSIAHYERLFRIRPDVLAHDAHPDYASTRYALGRGARDSLRVVGVQHHHAHFASCLADNSAMDPALGVCFDGTGYGLDGAIWGGEFLAGDCRHVERAAHLRYIRMPGGEKAIREPWRMAAAYLADADLDPGEWLQTVPKAHRRTIAQMIRTQLNSPPTSSAGRFFDAMAALLGIRHTVAYEGQAAMELEALAQNAHAASAYDFAVSATAPMVVDLRPAVLGVVEDMRRGASKAAMASRIHATLASVIESVCCRLAGRFGLKTVALSGGVFMNAILLEQATRRLERAGFRVLRHTRVPPNDGGLCLGQLAVVAAQPR